MMPLQARVAFRDRGPRRKRRTARRSQACRPALLLESLEARVVPATYIFGDLQFEADDAFADSGTQVTNSGDIAVGFAPSGGGDFSPFLTLSGDLTLNTSGDHSIVLDGQVAAEFDGTTFPLFDSGTHTFDLDDLLNDGVSALDGKQIAVAGATFTLDTIKLVDSPLDGPQVFLQGSLAIPSIAGLNVAVDGLNYVVIGGSGVSLTGVDATLSGSVHVGSLDFDATNLTIGYSSSGGHDRFTLAGTTSLAVGSEQVSVQWGGQSGSVSSDGLVIVDGALASLDMAVTGTLGVGSLSFAPDALTVAYAAASGSAPERFTVAGAAHFTLAGDSIDVQFGGGGTQGLVIAGGQLTNLDMSVTGSFTVLGVTIAAQGLTFEYDAAHDRYGMAGSLSISTTTQAVGSGTGKMFDGISATLGTAGSPGIVVQGGEIQSLDVTINGQFDLFGLTVAPNNLQIAYDAGDDLLQITGGLTVTELFSASASLPNGGLTIDVATGAVTVDGLVLSLSDVTLGAFTIQQFMVSYEQTPQGTDVDAAIELAFPGGWAVGGSIDIVDGEVQDVSLNYQDAQGEGIPIGPTGIFLTGMTATVGNIEQPDDLVVSGSLTFDLGPHVTIRGQSVAIISGTGTFTVDPNSLVITASVSMADGLLGQGSGKLSADWATGVYGLWVDVSMFDGTFDVSGDVQFNSQGDLLINANAAVRVPEAVPIIGGDTLGDIGFVFEYLSNNGNPTGYAAAWTSIDLWFTTETVGFQYDLNGGFSTIGSSGVSEDDVHNLPQTAVRSTIGDGLSIQAPTLAGGIQVSGSIPVGSTGSPWVTFYATTIPGGSTGVPIGTASTAAGTLVVGPNGAFSATLGAGPLNLPPGRYYIYAVLHDGRHAPVVSATTAAPITTAAVEGTVREANGSPVAGVLVRLFVGGDVVASTRTDVTGHYYLGSAGTAFSGDVALSEPEAVEYLTPGSVSVQYGGGATLAVDFRISNPASISGMIVAAPAGSDAKTPLAGRRVFLDLNGNGQLDEDEPSVVTDSRGRYRFRDVDPGTYRVVVVPPQGHTPNSGTSRSVTVADDRQQVESVDFDFARANQAPQSTVLNPTRPTVGNIEFLGTVSGSATDPDGRNDLAYVLVTVLDQTTGLYWNGSAFVASATPIQLTAHGTATWSLVLPDAALEDGHTYLIASVAVDAYHRAQDAPSTRTFTFVAEQRPDPDPGAGGDPGTGAGGDPGTGSGGDPAPTPTTESVATTTCLESSSPLAVGGEPITFVIRVTAASGTPGGSVQLIDGDRVLAVLTLDGGVATYRTTLAIGVHTLTARYLGDAGSRPSASAAVTQEVSFGGGVAGSPMGPVAVKVGGTDGDDIISVVRVGNGIRVVVRALGVRRPLFAQTFRLGRLSSLDLYTGEGRDVVRLGPGLPARLKIGLHDETGADVVRGARASRAIVRPALGFLHARVRLPGRTR